MIFRILLAYALISPVIGAAMMEFGWYGRSVNEWGYPNGAAVALLFYALCFLASWTFWGTVREVRDIGLDWRFRRLPAPNAAFWAAALLVPMAAFVLIGLNGWETIKGTVGAGEFRAGLSSGGAAGYLILKFYAPAIFAYLVCIYAERWRRAPPWGMVLPAFCLALIALSFGYKTALVLAVLPAVVLVFWRLRFKHLIYLGGAAFVTILAGFAYRWDEASGVTGLAEAIFYRAFVLHGDVPWRIWNLWLGGYHFPSYADTLPVVFGDRIYTFFTGITRAEADLWVDSHFGLMITKLSGYEAEYILSAGHTNVANVFSEGLIAGGIPGIIFFGLIAGFVVRLLHQFIENRLAIKDYGTAAIGACYWVYFVMPWLIGGGITSIAHISVIFGSATTLMLLRMFLGERRARVASKQNR